MSEKASGVYTKIVDNSIVATNDINFGVVFCGFSQRGNIGLNDITYSNFEKVIGYNTQYDNRIRGVKDYLSIAGRAQFLRLNVDAEARKAKFPETVTSQSPLQYEIGLKNPGTWNLGTLQVSVEPVFKNIEYNVSPIADSDYTVVLNFSTRPQSIIVKNPFGSIICREVTSGVLTSGSGTVGTVTRSATEQSTTLTFNGSSVASTLNYIFINIEYLDPDYNEYTARLYEFQGVRNELDSLTFSTDPSASDYFTEVTSDYLAVYQATSLISFSAIYSDSGFTQLNYTTMSSGSDGTTDSDDGLDLDRVSVSALESTKYPIVCLNGLTVTLPVVSKCVSLGKTVLVDLPAFTKFADLKQMGAGIGLPASEFVQIYWGKTVTKRGGLDTYIHTSVYVAEAYAKMYNATGRYSSAPAGYSYASVNWPYLLDIELQGHEDELKSLNVNYVKNGNNGAVIWEQKTNYGKDSDLSYASTVSIVRQIKESCVSFAENYMFVTQTPESWATFVSGVKSILDEAVSVSDLTRYEIQAPSWNELEAQHSRTVVVKIGLHVSQDYEVIWFELNINR